MVRVLVVEDSPVTREHLRSLLEEDPQISVVGVARDGLEAVEKTRKLHPDVVLMDVTMPRMDGYEATREIMSSAPVPIVMISSGFDTGGVATTFEALKAGAVAVVEKPVGGDHPDREASAHRICETVRLMAEVKVVRRWAKRSDSTPDMRSAPHGSAAPVKITRELSVEIIAVGASTGGPAVLVDILGSQPANLPVPILLVQHISPGFGEGLARWLNEQTPLRVKLAEPYERVQPGTVYLAPDGRQMGLAAGGRIHLTEGPPEAGFQPSISFTFRAVAARYRGAAMGVLLTGMGNDGAAGLLAIREAGGITLVQDQASSVIFGMAERAIRLGAVEHVLAPAEIARSFRSLLPTP